ncbi:MAG TPA: ABC transporter permease subunit [Acidimicrobiia bacterium]|nr:ABC transporter permease subunit [Acidimicrobiia bacterium]
MNPILYKEGIDRFRSRRVWPFLLFWVAFNGGLVYLLFLLASSITEQGFGPLIGRANIGPFLFHGVLSLMLLGVIMFLPGMAAVGIVGERERQTMRLLQTTSLTPFQIVTGKLGAALAYLGWLLVALLPIITAPLALGGVSLGDILGALLMLALIAVTIASMAIWLSSRARSTRSAVAGAYVLTFSLLFLTPLLGVGEALAQTRMREPLVTELWTVIPNPYLALVSAVVHPLEVDDGRWQTVFYPGYLVLLARDGVDAPGFSARDRVVEEDGRRFLTLSRPPLWVLSGLFYAGVTFLTLRNAVKWVTTPSPTEFSVKRTRGST